MSDNVASDAVTLVDAPLGYSIRVNGEHAGAIEGIPGELEYIELESHWEGQGVARAAIQEFVEMSFAVGYNTVRATNATHDAMEHILRTEGFVRSDDGWVYRPDE
jgi:GNAT superfamily N-acetyltransferase